MKSNERDAGTRRRGEEREDMSQANRKRSIGGRASGGPETRALVAQMLRRLQAGADLREAKIGRLRRAIAAQDYENPLKLDIAADRMADELSP